MCYPNEKLDILAEEKRQLSMDGDRRSNRSNLSRSLGGRNLNDNPLLDVWELIRNPVYVMIMLVICSMYFSSTGL